MSAYQRFPGSLRFAGFAAIFLLAAIAGCGAGTTTSSGTTTTTTTTNPYAAAYKAMTWGTGVTATFSGDCSMTLSASGVPPYHDAYYLAPATAGQTVVAVTPSGMSMAVLPYTGGISTVNKISATFNICPSKASTTTATSKGSIGVISSGETLFNPYEATGTVALGDNVSYTFTSGGTTYTASFIDQCNSHAAAGQGSSGSTWHYHGVPTCWTQSVDGATGASHIIGIALDGFPIYGGRDMSGNVVSVSQLDACNGITSATPEFPSGAYHYVLPVGVTDNRSSLGCYTGTVNATVVAQAKTLACHMKGMRMDGM